MIFLAKYWKPLAVVILLAGMWGHGYTRGKAGQVQKQAVDVSVARKARINEYETAIADYKSRLTQQEADTAALSVSLAAEQAKVATLLEAISKAPLVRYVTNPSTGCPEPHRTDRYRLLWNSAVTGVPLPAASP